MASSLQPSVEYYVAACFSFSLVLALAFMVRLSPTPHPTTDDHGQYFDVIPQKNTTHALGVSRLSGTINPRRNGDPTLIGMTWLMLHPVYGFCLFGIPHRVALPLSDLTLQ